MGRSGAVGRLKMGREGGRDEQLRWSQHSRPVMSDNLTATKATSNHGSATTIRPGRGRLRSCKQTLDATQWCIQARSLAIASWLPWCRGQLLEARFCRATASLSVEMSVFSSTDRGRGRGPALQCREGDHGRIIARSSAPRRPARLSQRVANAR